MTVSLHTISYLCLLTQINRSAQIVPLLSKSSRPLPANFTVLDLEALTKRVQFGGDEVVKAKDGGGSATLPVAYAGAEFAAKILCAIKGETDITTPSYVNLTSDPSGGEALKKELRKELEYFSSVVELGVSLVPAFDDLISHMRVR